MLQDCYENPETKYSKYSKPLEYGGTIINGHYSHLEYFLSRGHYGISYLDFTCN